MTETLITLADIQAAAERIAAAVAHPALVRFHGVATPLWLKPEGFQPTGSFKVRGAYNTLAQLTAAERERGVIAYSSGNHAQAVAFAASRLGVRATIVMPRNAPAIKLARTRQWGAEVVLAGPGGEERQALAEALAAEHGYIMVPPFNHPAVIAGQGTMGLEILAELPEVGCVLVPVGGGGLLSGVAAAIKLQRPDIAVIGVEPELAGDAAQSLATGQIVTFTADETGRTLADGLRTQRVGALTFAHMRQFADQIITVSEAEISAALRRLAFDVGLVAEPSGAVTLAAALFHGAALPAVPTVAIMCGANVDPALYAQLLTAPDDEA